MFKKQPRTVDSIVADLDKITSELSARQAHDVTEIQKINDDEAELIRQHETRLAELAAKRSEHTESHARAVRVHGKISDLLK